MVSLWPIPEEARKALENGEHVKLTNTGYPNNPSVVVGFEEHVDDSYEFCEWELTDGWKGEQ